MLLRILNLYFLQLSRSEMKLLSQYKEREELKENEARLCLIRSKGKADASKRMVHDNQLAKRLL